MLQIKNICKEYRTGGLVQKALDDVSLNLRDNEFVAILGPSGSGKTTLLNIIGGLDRYDSAALPFIPAVVLILLSIGLTLLGGLIPSRKAAPEAEQGIQTYSSLPQILCPSIQFYEKSFPTPS